MALVVKTKTDFWGLVEQKGPWATTSNDVKNSRRHPAKRGGAIQEAAGGVNARRATFTPYNAQSKRVKGMSRITLKSLVSSGEPRRLNGGLRQPRTSAMRRQAQPTSMGGTKVTTLQDFQEGGGASSIGQSLPPSDFGDDDDDPELERFLTEKGMIGQERFTQDVDLPGVPGRRPSQIAFEGIAQTTDPDFPEQPSARPSQIERDARVFPDVPPRDLSNIKPSALQQFREGLPGAFPDEEFDEDEIPDIDTARSSLSSLGSLSSVLPSFVPQPRLVDPAAAAPQITPAAPVGRVPDFAPTPRSSVASEIQDVEMVGTPAQRAKFDAMLDAAESAVGAGVDPVTGQVFGTGEQLGLALKAAEGAALLDPDTRDIAVQIFNTSSSDRDRANTLRNLTDAQIDSIAPSLVLPAGELERIKQSNAARRGDVTPAVPDKRRPSTEARPAAFIKRKSPGGAQDVRVGKKQKQVPTLDLDPKRIEIEFGAPRGARDLKKVSVSGGATEAEAELLLGVGASAPTKEEAELLLGVSGKPTEEEAELLLGVGRSNISEAEAELLLGIGRSRRRSSRSR